MKLKRYIAVLVFVGVAIAGGGFGWTSSVAAHHAIQAEFDTAKTGEFTGVLTRFAMVNPHVRWYFDVKQPDGTVAKWELTASGPGAMRDAGLAKIFKAGATYHCTFAPAFSGANVGRLRTMTFPDGRKVTLFHQDPTKSDVRVE
jgi:hypothetical protein